MRGLFLGVVAVLWSSIALADSMSAVGAVRTLPGVLNAVDDGRGNLWVAVQNRAGAQWNAYATEMCKVIRPYRARLFLVKVVDFTTIRPKSKPKDWLLLGGANCGMVPGAPPATPPTDGGGDSSSTDSSSSGN
jgi:hypothetical protein